MNNKNTKHSKLLISLTSIFSSLSFGVIILNSINLNMNNNSLNANNINSNDLALEESNKLENKKESDNIKPLIVNETNYFNPRLSSKNGPILFWKEKITSVDWFGAERWSIDVSTLKDDNGSDLFVSPNGSWIRRWLNFDLDKKRDILYVLSNGGSNKQQVVIAIDVANGNIINKYKTKTQTDNYNNRYFGLSVLDNGNILVYCKQGNVVTQSDLINTRNGEVTQNQGNLSSIAPKPEKGTRYLMNLIPIGNNRNMAMTYVMTSKSGTQGDAGKENEDTSQVEFLLCDDNMNVIPNANSKWKTPQLVTKAITGTRNSAIWPQRDWYKLLDGRVVTVIYDKLVIIDGSNDNNPSFTTYTLDNDKWIESWSFDTDEKLYFKSKDKSVIQTITLDPTKGNNHTKSTYYDLNNSISQIQKHANNFTLFNVYGYSGQIMLINPYFNRYVNSYKESDYPNQEQMASNQYGLAAAITNNKNNVGQGDTKGLLNTIDAFQKSADFTINNEVLKNKLPSEISKSDLLLENQSFFTQRNNIENGQLKYIPFLKTKINDSSKELEVTVNLDQIPWFVSDNKMPNDIKPLTLVKTFNSEVNINSRFTWKNSNIDDYDFKNTLPSKVTIEDIKRISPLVSTLSSQSALINGERYPKVEYKMSEQDDATGNIKINASYSYLPVDTPIDINNVKTYNSEKQYTIFKSTDIKNFSFVKENNSSSSSTNINNIPALKELKEANLFPSHFKNSSNKQEFLKFINVNETKGYPLEKMNISVEANDDEGTLKVIVDPTNYDNSLNKQIITYNGLNKNNNYSFKFIEPTLSKFDKKNYRPSDITDEHIFTNFIEYSGFDSSDLSLELNSNNGIGSLNINVFVNVAYPINILTNNGFSLKDGKYVKSMIINGFKNDETFNKEYQLTYKDNSSNDLLKFKEFTPAFIKENLESKKLTIGNKTYTDKFEFAKEFVSSYGSKLKPIDTKTNIAVEMFYNNSGGEITFNITYSKLEGYSNPITFIQKFSGFAKGNDVVTEDVLTFKDSSQLKATHADYFKMKPSEIVNALVSDKSKISDFILGKATGSYEIAISSNKFELILSSDDNYGTLIINIKFKRNDILNSNSLLEYSQTFDGFNHY